MRILMLVQREGIRGAAPKISAHLIAALDNLGVTVVTHDWGRRSDREHIVTKLRRGLGDVLSVWRAVRGIEFDMAIVNTAHDWRTVPRDVAVALVLRRRRPPVVLQLHGSRAADLVRPGARAFKQMTALLLRLTDGVLVLSGEEQRDIRAFRPATRVHVVKNPYERRQYPTVGARGRGSDPPVLLFVGRLLREKGLLDLVEAMPSVVAQVACRLDIVGEGELESTLRRLIQRLHLEDSVKLVGYLEGEALLRAYADADLFVLPSWSEGFPTVLAEAMDAGLPIVTTRIRGAADHLVEGQHAVFVSARDVRGLSSALVALIRDPALRSRMGTANQKRIEMFDPHVVAQDYLQVLRALAPDVS
jgi:glycosyltransferase involved in cell wall biosynthesis